MGDGFGREDPWRPRDPNWDHAIARLSQRADPARVEKELVSRGLTPVSAREMLEAAQDAVCSARRRAGVMHTLGGVALTILGVALTMFSYSRAAANPEGGTYGIYWGAVAAGIVYLGYGLTTLRRARPESVRRAAKKQ